MPDVCWKYNTTERKWSRRFLECMEDKFLMQLVREPNREGTPLDLLFAKRKGLLCDEKIGGCLGHSDPEMIALSILTEVRRGISRTATLDFQRADLGLFRRPVERVAWEAVLKDRGVQEGWTFFKTEIFKVQEQAVSMCWKMSQQGRKPAWLNRELWKEFRRKKKRQSLQSFWPLEERADHARELHGCHEVKQRGN